MKRLFYLILLITTVQSFGQTPARKTGFTQYFSNNQFNRIWADSTANVPVKDTTSLPVGVGEKRFRIQDSTEYIWTGQRWKSSGGSGVAGSGDSTFIKPYAHLTALRGDNFYTHAGSLVAKLQGYNSPGDGGGTDFYWDGSSSATDDGVFVIKPSAVSGSGRWLKIFKGVVRASEAGVKTDGTSQTTLLNTLFSNSTINKILFDNGTTTITGKVNAQGKTIGVDNGAILAGDGGDNDTLDNVSINAPMTTQIFDPNLAVTNLNPYTIPSVMWFGAKGDFVSYSSTGTDNLIPFQRALNAVKEGYNGTNIYYLRRTSLYIPATSGKYYLSGTWTIDASVTVFGDGVEQSQLVFAQGDTGIILQYPKTSAPIRKGAYRVQLHDFALFGGIDNQSDSVKEGISGVVVQTNFTSIKNLGIYNFWGDGLRISASVPDSNANNGYFEHIEANGNGVAGIRCVGTDANNCTFIACQANNNGRFGILDQSFIGNNWFSFHVAANAVEHSKQRTFVLHGTHYYYCIKDNGVSSTIYEPGVTSGWQTYWQDLGTVYSGNPGFAIAWVNTSDYFEGRQYLFSRSDASLSFNGNQRGVAIGCYSEGGYPAGQNRSNTIFLNGFAVDNTTYLGIGATGNGLQFNQYANAYDTLTRLHVFLDGSDNRIGFYDEDNVSSIEWKYYKPWKSMFASHNNATSTVALLSSDADPSIIGRTSWPSSVALAAYDGVFMGSTLRNVNVGSAAPTTGYHAASDVVINNGTDTTIVLWRCTVSGTPGTWQTIKSGNASGATTGTPGRIALYNQSTGALTDDADLKWTTSRVDLNKDTLAVNDFLITKEVNLPTTAYVNSGGSGDRTASITATTTLGFSGTWNHMVNGVKAPETGLYFTGTAASGNYMTFDFGVGQSKVVTELTWYQSAGAFSHGVWKGQASDDGSTWTDVSSNQTLGGAASSTFTLSPTKGYRYYRLAGVSGTTGGSPWLEEIEFKINDASAGSQYVKLQSPVSIKMQEDSGTVEVPTPNYGDSSRKAANTAWVTHKTDSIANLFSVTSGTYEPVISSATNITSSTTYSNVGYSRIGNQIYVNGKVTIQPTATGTVTFLLSLPISTGTFSSDGMAAGGIFADNSDNANTGRIYATVSDSKVTIKYKALTTSSTDFSFSFSYTYQAP